MKIKTKQATLAAALARPRPKHQKPRRPLRLFRALLRIASWFDLRRVRFTHSDEGMEKVGRSPALILMNHSSFVDLEIAFSLFHDRPFCTVCTSDGFVGKAWLMRCLGCIPTQKFVSDLSLIRDMQHALHKQGASVLMYPEASYTFDGTTTPLPRRLGMLFKMLKVPVIMVKVDGAFLRDPLYNGLQVRRTAVHAHRSCLFTAEEVAALPVEELDRRLDEAFAYDHFATQYEKKIAITEGFRADYLHRILYRCAACGAEGQMHGAGTALTCRACGRVWQMDVYGRLAAEEGETRFPHIPDWYAWQRACVRADCEGGTYRLDTPVRIGVLTDYRAIYMVGQGRLVHDGAGFSLYDAAGTLLYTQSCRACYSAYADYYWYELGDVICIGNREALYYCFPDEGVAVAKVRLAAEELYKTDKEAKAPKDA